MSSILLLFLINAQAEPVLPKSIDTEALQTRRRQLLWRLKR